MAAYNERASVSELAYLFSKKIDLTGPAKPIPSIVDQAGLDAHLPSLCQSIFDALSSRQCEATYQRCLALDLEEAGVTVASEVSMTLAYKGRSVGTRRADLVLQTADKSLCVLELKATAALTSDNLKQIEFYMHYLSIDVGYLVNFPHDSGFPDVPGGGEGGGGSGGGGGVFVQTLLLGSAQILSDWSIRGKHEGATVQIIKVERQHGAIPSGPPRRFGDLNRAPAPPSPTRTYGLTLKGLPCKVCLKQQGFCAQHTDQKPKFASQLGV
jgi:GxxExxY protein